MLVTTPPDCATPKRCCSRCRWWCWIKLALRQRDTRLPGRPCHLHTVTLATLPLPSSPFCRRQEMEDEKSFKDKQLKSAEATMRRLHQDKEKRLQEMAKVKTLDEKVRCGAGRAEKRRGEGAVE